MKYVKLFIILIALGFLTIGCSGEKTSSPAPEQQDTSTQTEEESEESVVQEPANEDPGQGEMEASLSPIEDISKYDGHEGVIFLQEFTELIRSRQYEKAIQYFTPDMLAEIEAYGYDNPVSYLEELYQGTDKNDIELVLYDVKEESISSAVTRQDGETPFSAYLKDGVWTLFFSPVN
ncbi:hypothetical protein [Candidatus Formimonas warabiya]|uniref:Uncharacterized protein n=1 Tax=Formimonas warabiya TaxID=1761012 RepID=A0A3G1L0R7_FORW1|nr:hypothetical protein [Candidatus Formimonas warabiya]ATW28234.1 hypothetical protein DCMF_28850 [Candidatus Formimonas warabiya]